MKSCARCCLHNSLRIVNFVTTLLGIAVIVYSLWLQKKWNEGVAQLPTTEFLPRPWFIYTCLGVGIAICLSTLFGYVVAANCITRSSLCIYIVSLCSLLLLEFVVIVAIFFKYDWSSKIAEYIDQKHREFETFVTFHVNMCRFIAILILVPQISVVTLAIILWAIGAESLTRSRNSPAVQNFTRSFLVGSGSSILNYSNQICSTCQNVQTGNPTAQRLLSNIEEQ